MPAKLDPRLNYEATREAIGYVSRRNATQSDYDRLGFMSGLEVHQQLNTSRKLFCRCPTGIYQEPDDYDAEIIRHMRPTLGELGEHDSTALMEFKTRKTIIYRVKGSTACTYEIDDASPFLINQEALAQAIEISLLCRLNIVGEVHITRKHYLDGSIPAGFQRTAIIGVEGEIPLKDKNIRVIQLCIEEDTCREVSDKGHVRVFRTDRMGMPLIEIVTYPDMVNPDEVMEACNYIRFLNRSTGKVRTGMGAARQDVNVSCKGGARVEIKGVAHTKWIPELTHNEVFRQYALLNIRARLLESYPDWKDWKISSQKISRKDIQFKYEPLAFAQRDKLTVYAVNLPGFKSILSHFTQPGKIFADEISDRIKVIACIDKPNMVHSEMINSVLEPETIKKIESLLQAKENDAQVIIWGPSGDIPTALETIEERCILAFQGVPKETRKSFKDGTTIFERVLPGANRMYPDTDSPPIPLKDEHIEEIRKQLPEDVIDRYHKLKNWNMPEDTYIYIFKKNLFPLVERIVNELDVPPLFCGTFFGHNLKNIEWRYKPSSAFNYKTIYGLFKFLKEEGLDFELAKKMMPVVYQYPKMEFDSVLVNINYKPVKKKNIIDHISFLKKKFIPKRNYRNPNDENNWIMGQLRQAAIGNMSLTELAQHLK